MLVAKVNPPAKRVYQDNPFHTAEITAEYMVAKCTQLAVSPVPNSPSDEIIFKVRFGQIRYDKNPDGSNGNPILDTIITARVTFTTQELSNWGTDDTYVYQKIAEKLGFNIVSTEILPMHYNG